jgi:hypothetical protein
MRQRIFSDSGIRSGSMACSDDARGVVKVRNRTVGLTVETVGGHPMRKGRHTFKNKGRTGFRWR